MYTPTSPHLPANDPRYASMPFPPYRPPNFDEDTTTDGEPFYVAHPMRLQSSCRVMIRSSVMTMPRAMASRSR